MIDRIDSNIIKKLLDRLKVDKIQKIVVGGVIFNSKNKLLLLKRASDDFMGDLVELPSGTVDEDETILEALRREIKEETSLDIDSIDKYIGSFDYLSSSGKKTRQLNFLLTTNSSSVKLSPKEHSAYYWININNDSDKIGSLNISLETKNIIKNTKRKNYGF
jgi:8-oxo-dGTP diphosphatase